MRFEKIDPPGTWCHYQAVFEVVERLGGKTFVEVGCGAGDLSHQLCQRGFRGVGMDFSEVALEQAQQKMSSYIADGHYTLTNHDIMASTGPKLDVDLGLSMMVMEHVEDHVGFLQNMSHHVRPDGHVIVAVPGRRDRWSIEDETVGHLRRYDRNDLHETMEQAGLRDVQVWSVAVPTANLLFRMSNYLVRASGEERKRQMAAKEQTQLSGVREIPFKTVFPPWCRLILNSFTLAPLFAVQRLFYRSNLGLTMLGFGRVQS